MASKRGVLMYAHNNPEIDYVGMALTNAAQCWRHLDINGITVVTDPHTMKHAKKVYPNRLDRVTEWVVVDKNQSFKEKNIRPYRDTAHTTKSLSFYNYNRCDAGDITTYGETLLIDADYLIQSSTLNSVWGHSESLMMNWQWQDLHQDRVDTSLDYLWPLGITQYWATVVYWRQDAQSEAFFEVAKHVRDHPQYYRDLYKWQGSIYRNDYSFSIAAHTIMGYRDRALPQLPTTLYKTFDRDDVHSVPAQDEVIMYLEKPRSPGDFELCRWSNMDLHIMNKWALGRIQEDLEAHNE